VNCQSPERERRGRAEPVAHAPGSDKLAPLPLAALRLPAETLDLLAHLGLHRIDDLLHLPRSDLVARFGALLLRRLDQAFGRVPELIVPPQADPELQVERQLDFPTERYDEVCQLLEGLAQELCPVLEQRNLGARQLGCWLFHETAPATAIEVGLYRPSASPAYLASLLRTRLEQMRLPAPVCAVRLGVARAERLAVVQRAFFEKGASDDEALTQLIDRLSNQLGSQAVTRPRCVPDAQPERAFIVEPILRREPIRPRGRQPPQREPAGPLLPRPLTLWPEPIGVEMLAEFADGSPQQFAWAGAVYSVRYSWGPERIETGWWRGEDVRRDYYVVTTQAGCRFWMFRAREDGCWFLQGCFD
jgi:protein ImuB